MESSERPRGFRRSISFWVAVALVASFILSLLISPIWFLSPLLPMFAVGPLAELLLLTLFVEAVSGRIPRFLMAPPILLFGAYFALFIQDTARFREAVASAHLGRLPNVIHFDPASQLLVVPHAKDAIAQYSLPAAYEVNPLAKPEGYLAWRLLPPAQCLTVLITRTVPTVTRRFSGESRIVPRDDGCLFAAPQRPRGHVIAVTVATQRKDDASRTGPMLMTADTTTTSIDVERDGKVVARDIVGIDYERLPIIPWLIMGFVVTSDRGPTPVALLWRSDVTVGHAQHVDDPSFILPITAAMLDLDRRRPEGGIPPARGLDAVLATLPPNADWAGSSAEDPFLQAFAAVVTFDGARVTLEKAGKKESVFGDAEPPTQGAFADVLINRAAYVPLRGRMIEKLIAWQEAGIDESNDWVKLVQHTLTIIPKADLATIPSGLLKRFLAYLGSPGPHSETFLTMYARMGVIGKRVLPFYEATIASSGGGTPKSYSATRDTYALLAICQAGVVDQPTHARLAADYLKPLSNTPALPDYLLGSKRAATFLALLSIGDTAFLRYHQLLPPGSADREWAALLLAGKGWVHGRPDNCHYRSYERSRGRPVGEYDPTGPGLAWSWEKLGFAETQLAKHQ